MAEKIYKLLLSFMYDRTWQDIREEFLNYLSRMRLVDSDKFKKLNSGQRIELIFNLNEDQMTGRAKNFFRQLIQDDFSKEDLLEALDLLSHRGNDNEEVIIYSPVLISTESMKDISKSMVDKMGREVRVVYKVDPELILGCRIEYANQIKDYSFAQQSLSLINAKLNTI